MAIIEPADIGKWALPIIGSWRYKKTDAFYQQDKVKDTSNVGVITAVVKPSAIYDSSGNAISVADDLLMVQLNNSDDEYYMDTGDSFNYAVNPFKANPVADVKYDGKSVSEIIKKDVHFVKYNANFDEFDWNGSAYYLDRGYYSNRIFNADTDQYYFKDFDPAKLDPQGLFMVTFNSNGPGGGGRIAFFNTSFTSSNGGLPLTIVPDTTDYTYQWMQINGGWTFIAKMSNGYEFFPTSIWVV